MMPPPIFDIALPRISVQAPAGMPSVPSHQELKNQVSSAHMEANRVSQNAIDQLIHGFVKADEAHRAKHAELEKQLAEASGTIEQLHGNIKALTSEIEDLPVTKKDFNRMMNEGKIFTLIILFHLPSISIFDSAHIYHIHALCIPMTVANSRKEAGNLDSMTGLAAKIENLASAVANGNKQSEHIEMLKAELQSKDEEFKLLLEEKNIGWAGAKGESSLWMLCCDC